MLRGIWTRPGTSPINVAVKTLRPDSVGSGHQEFLREANVMHHLNHPNVVRLLGVCLMPSLMIVQELVPLGSLLGKPFIVLATRILSRLTPAAPRLQATLRRSAAS